MEMMSVSQAAERWNVTLRRVQDLCKRGEIPGVLRLGRAWMIPAGASYPVRREEGDARRGMLLPGQTPLLSLTGFAGTPGAADLGVRDFADYPEAVRLYRAELAYERGELDAVYEAAQHFLARGDDFCSSVVGGILLARCAVWSGDILMWRDATLRIREASESDDADPVLTDLASIAVTTQVRLFGTLPAWFITGKFEVMPPDTYSGLRVLYASHMFNAACEAAVERMSFSDAPGLGLMRALPYIIQPMIAESKTENAFLSELHLRLVCAIAYHHIGENEKAAAQTKAAVALALPDQLYGTLAECRGYLDNILDDCIGAENPKALARVRELYRTWSAGWSKVHGVLVSRNVCADLAPREREVARLAAFGLTNRQIAEQLGIAESTVNQAIRIAVYKSGVSDRNELKHIL